LHRDKRPKHPSAIASVSPAKDKAEPAADAEESDE
jgi:hypothetical protein